MSNNKSKSATGSLTSVSLIQYLTWLRLLRPLKAKQSVTSVITLLRRSSIVDSAAICFAVHALKRRESLPAKRINNRACAVRFAIGNLPTSRFIRKWVGLLSQSKIKRLSWLKPRVSNQRRNKNHKKCHPGAPLIRKLSSKRRPMPNYSLRLRQDYRLSWIHLRGSRLSAKHSNLAQTLKLSSPTSRMSTISLTSLIRKRLIRWALNGMSLSDSAW